MAIGYLMIQARTAHDALPLSGVQIRVTDGQGNTIYELTTDESGETERVELETLDRSLSLDPNHAGTPFLSYDVLALADGFHSVHVTGIPILEGETAIQQIDFIPMQGNQRTPIVTEVEVGAPAASMTGGRYQEEPVTESRVLRQVVIPNPITVHLGSPGSSATNVQVSFPDYVKNVASSEVYPTWPDAALRANVYAIITFALNRVYTEWYRVHHSFIVAGI